MSETAGQSAPLHGKLSVQQLELIIRQIDSLPTLPRVASRLLELTAGGARSDDREALLAQAAEVIASDPSLTARVMSLANASGAGEARSAAQAVRALGLEAVRSAVLLVKVPEALDPGRTGDSGMDGPAFRRHCLAVASAAEKLAAGAKGGPDAEEAFTCGLLHDIGKLVLAGALPKSYARSLAAARARDGDLAECERDVLGVDHLVAGRRLAERWNLPRRVQDVIWLHHQPTEALPVSMGDTTLIRIVALADAIARRERIGFSGNCAFAQPTGDLAHGLGIDTAVVEEVAAGLPAAVEHYAALLGLDKAGGETIYRQALVAAGAELSRLNEQLGRRNAELAAQAAAMGLFGDFAADLSPDAVVGDVLAAVAEVFRAAGGHRPAGPLAAYSIDEQAGSMLAVVCHDAQPRWRHFALAGPPQARRVEEAPLSAAETVGLLLADPPQWGEWHDAAGLTHQPLVCRGRWLGGVFHPPLRPGEPGQLAVPSLQALAAALGMALALVQQRCRAVAVGEALAGASQALAGLQDARAEARTVQAVRDLAAGAAHELNNPLAIVSGRAQLMRDRAATPEERKCWQLIAGQAQRISDIITDLMDFASPPPPRPERIDAPELLQSAAAAFSSSPHPQAGSCRVDIDMDEDTPAIWADRSQILAVLKELMANAAMAASSAPRICLKAEADEINAGVLLQVRDDGPGMDEQTAARAWTPFFSVQPAGRRRGLGLPRAKRYIEGNGGRIWLHSKLGEGTTVFLQLPRADRPGPQDGAVDRRP